MACIASLLFSIVQFAAIVLITVAIPFGMFQPANEKALHISNSYCINIWGIKDNCLRTSYAYKPNTVFANCDGRAGRFKAAEVCAIVSLAIFAVSFVLGLLMCCCCPCMNYVCMLLNIAAVVVVTVCWGCMLDCYLRKMGSDTITYPGVDVCVKMKDFTGTDGQYTNGMRLGTGFILMIIGWALGLVNIFFLLIPC